MSPSLPLHRRGGEARLTGELRHHLQRALAILDEAAMTGNLTKLGQVFGGDALSEVRDRFEAYQMAGIQVSPFRDSVRLELVPDSTNGPVRAHARYRDRTSFLCAGSAASTADEEVTLLLAFDGAPDGWRVVSVKEV